MMKQGLVKYNVQQLLVRVLLPLMLLTGIASHAFASPQKAGLKIYKGAYFQVSYPGNFSVKNANPLGDEASFVSPDGKVEFFVYSPLWTGKPKNYHLVWANEVVLAEDAKKSFHENRYLNYALTRWKTMKARNNAYQRSYVWRRACHDDGVSTFNDCETTFFGIKYKNQKAYQRYRNAYIAFKKSLQKFADDELLDEDLGEVFGDFTVIDYPMKDKDWQRQIRILNKGKEIWNSEKINDGSFVRLFQDSKIPENQYQFVDLSGDSLKNAIVLVGSGGASCCFDAYLLTFNGEKAKISPKIIDTGVVTYDICQFKKAKNGSKMMILSAVTPVFDKTGRRSYPVSKYKVASEGFTPVSKTMPCQ